MKKEYIILVEDEPTQAKLFGSIIEKIAQEFGFKSLTIKNGEEILAFIKGEQNNLGISKEQVGLIILDLSLSGSDVSGFYILKELQKLTDKIPVIVQSADSSHTSIIRAMKLGAQDYFLKNGDKEEGERIFDTIEKIIKSV
jgi:DNA-binding response OmpR family regulator